MDGVRVALSAVEERTRAFFAWERRGRGWTSYPYRVALEPPFLPLSIPRPIAPVDDARLTTTFSRWVDRLVGREATAQVADDLEAEPCVEGPDAALEGRIWEEFELLPSPQDKLDLSLAESWLGSLVVAEAPVAAELVGNAGGASARIVVTSDDARVVLSQMRSRLRCLTRRAEPLGALWAETSSRFVGALEFGLGSEFMLPLRTGRASHDPLAGVIGALRDTRSREVAVLQVLLEHVRAPWDVAVLRAVITTDGKPFFADAPDFTARAREKVAAPLCTAVIRVVASADNEDRVWELLRGLAGGLSSFATPDGNELVPLGGSDATEVLEDVLDRATHRSGMILSTAELAGLVHPPAVPLGAETEAVGMTKRAPAEARARDGVLLGHNEHGGKSVEVRLSVPTRLRHVYVVGASGTGKSTLLSSLIVEDIEAGHGVAVLDPHGDLVEEVLGRIPEHRLDDVIYFDPADREYRVGWNVLGAHSETEREMLASDLVAVFRRLSTSWGDQMTTVLANAVLAFLSSPHGGSLLDLRRFLIDEEFRGAYLATVDDEYVASYWRDDFPILVGKKPQGPILTRLDSFLRSRTVREVVTESKRPLDFRAVVDGGRIFLGKLSQGAIGVENAAFLGSLVVSKLHQVALSRQDIAESERRPFFLYLDEFQELATPSLAQVFSGVRKYRLGLTVAHQELYQLHQKLPEVEHAVLANAHTRICFRVSDDDARKLERGFEAFDSAALAGLGTGEAIVRVGRRQDEFNLRTRSLPALDATTAEARRAAARERSRARYGSPAPEAALRGLTFDDLLPAKRPDVPPPRAEAPPPSGPLDVRATATPPAPPSVPMPQAPAEVPQAPSRAPAEPGRGGAEHKYLQGLIRQWGQARGFQVIVEQSLAGGGRVDVGLRRGELSVAVEITVTTGREHELGNLRKCLAAPFDHVVVVSLRKSFLAVLGRAATSELSEAEQEKVSFLAPEELLTFLDGLPAGDSDERVAGWRVRARYKSDGGGAPEERKRVIAATIAESLRRLRKE